MENFPSNTTEQPATQEVTREQLDALLEQISGLPDAENKDGFTDKEVLHRMTNTLIGALQKTEMKGGSDYEYGQNLTHAEAEAKGVRLHFEDETYPEELQPITNELKRMATEIENRSATTQSELEA